MRKWPSASRQSTTTSSARTLALQHGLFLILTAASLSECLQIAASAPSAATHHLSDGAGGTTLAPAPASTDAASSSGGCGSVSDRLALSCGSGSRTARLQQRRLQAGASPSPLSATQSVQPCRSGVTRTQCLLVQALAITLFVSCSIAVSFRFATPTL